MSNHPDSDDRPEAKGKDLDLEFTTNRKPLAGEIDMTPMADVTFLLLIFFMVTVSFTIIRSVEQPKPNAESGPMVSPIDEDQIVVVVDQYNTFQISVLNDEEIEAASNFEMRQIVRQAVNDYSPERMVIITHEESALNKLIAAYSAARVFGIGTIETKTTDRDF